MAPGARTVTTAHRRDGTASWAHAWPLGRRAAGAYGISLVVVTVGLIGLGLLVVHVLDSGPLGRADRAVAQWFVDRRTPTWETLAHIGSALSDTVTLTPAVVVACVAMPLLLRRWHDAVMLGGSLLFEKLAFVVATMAVGRPRPPVPQLDSVPPTSSFPSGHVGAAVAGYVAFAVVVCWHVRRPLVRGAVRALAVAAPVAVALARMYLGMHHLSDVVVGAVLGLVAVVVTYRCLQLGVEEHLARREDLPERCRRLDLTAPATEPARHEPALRPAGPSSGLR